jgi:hypothetical protein
MQTDEQFAQQLLLRMREETREIRASPGLAGTVHARYRRRRFAMRGALAAGLVVAVSVSAAVALDRPAATSGNVAAPPVVDAAFVAAHLAALGPATDYVVKTRLVRANQVSVQWVDRATGDMRGDVFAADGSPQTSVSQTGDFRKGATVVYVDFTTRTWRTYTRDPIPNAVVPPAPAPDSVSLGAYADPQNLRSAIDKGWLTVVGPEQVNGVATTHVRLSLPSPKSVTIDAWLDDATFLPIRMDNGLPGDRDTMELSWLPRTPANLAEVTVTVPAGFTKTAVPSVPDKLPPN